MTGSGFPVQAPNPVGHPEAALGRCCGAGRRSRDAARRRAASRVLLRRVDGRRVPASRRHLRCGARRGTAAGAGTGVRGRLPGLQDCLQQNGVTLPSFSPGRDPAASPARGRPQRPSGSGFRGGFGGGALGASASPRPASAPTSGPRPSRPAPPCGRRSLPVKAGPAEPWHRRDGACRVRLMPQGPRRHGDGNRLRGSALARPQGPDGRQGTQHLCAADADAQSRTVTERQQHGLSSDGRREAYALRTGIDVHRRATNEPSQHQTGRPRDVDGQRRRGGHRRKCCDACKNGFLRELEGCAATHLEDVRRRGQQTFPQSPAHDLVHGVVTTDVLADAHDRTVCGEQAGGMQPPCPPERGLTRTQGVRKR